MKVKHIIKLINGRFLNQEEEDQAKKEVKEKQNKQKIYETVTEINSKIYE